MCSRHSKLLAFRWSDLPHALHFSLQQYASLWPLLGNAHFVARAAVLLMRSVALRVVYADSFGRTFARRMAGSTHHDAARAVHSTRTRAALLAMPSLWYSHGTDLAPDALGSSDRAISFAACSAHVAVVCVFACVFACAGNGARLVVQLADAADGRSRRPAAAGASAPSSSCDAPPLPGGPPQRRGVAGTPRCAAPSSCRCRA